MRPHLFIGFAILLAAPAAAETYKWVDERGITHYSDRRPTEAPASAKVEPVANRVSVYSPEKSLLEAVAAARFHRPAPEPPLDHPRGRVQYGTAMQGPPPLTSEPCVLTDCAIGAAGVPYPYPVNAFHRRPPLLVPAVLPPGAIAGTINSNGAIPGNTAGLNNVLPEPVKAGPRMRANFPEPRR